MNGVPLPPMRRTLLVALVAATAVACTRAEGSRRTVGDLVVTLSAGASQVRVGEVLLKTAVRDAGGTPVQPAQVRFHYYPFVHRVKDSLASPDEVVRVVEAAPDGEAYVAKANFDRPGPWKVTVVVARPERPEATATFTFDVGS